MWIAIGIVGGIIAVVFILLVAMPSNVEVSVSRTVNGSADKAFAQVNHLPNWEAWSPWHKIDPNQKVTYSDPNEGQGAWYSWESDNKNVDHGKLTLLKVVPNERIETKIEFRKWGQNFSNWSFDENDGKTTITWHMQTDMKGMAKLFAPMMKGMLNKQFNEGLDGIQTAVEV